MFADYLLCDNVDALSWESGVIRKDFSVIYPVDLTGITLMLHEFVNLFQDDDFSNEKSKDIF